MNVVQCLSHSIESYDMLKLYARLGVDAFDVGGYVDPSSPHDDKRPGVPEMPYFPELAAACAAEVEAQERLPDAVLDWADVIVWHHALERLYGQWDRIYRWLKADSGHRVIWRTVGQSVEDNERAAKPFRNEGLEIVRYSPKERNIPAYAGEDALIRFYKDPADWYGWTGDNAVVGNVTQDLQRRGEWTNYAFWEEATAGLPRLPAGPGSEQHGGLGSLTYDEMRQYLRDIRVYLYTGTQPASYTLGLIEAMMTGVPVVSMGKRRFSIFAPYGPEMFEGPELTWPNIRTTGLVFARSAYYSDLDEPNMVQSYLRQSLESQAHAQQISDEQRAFAIATFGINTVADQWAAFLGVKVPVAA